MKKIFIYSFLIFALIFPYKIIHASNVNLDITGKIGIKSPEELKEDNPELYKNFTEYKEKMILECDKAFGKDNYYYILSKNRVDSEREYSFVNGGSTYSQDFFESKCIDKKNVDKSYFYAYFSYSSINFFSKTYFGNEKVVLSNTSNSSFWSYTDYMSSTVFSRYLGQDISQYMETNLDIYFNNDFLEEETDEKYNFNSITYNKGLYNKGDLFIKNNEFVIPGGIPSDTVKEDYYLDSDTYKYFDWRLDLSKVYDDVWFEMDRPNGSFVSYDDMLKFTYTIKGESKEEIILPQDDGSYKYKFSKNFLDSIEHLRIEFFIPYNIDNIKYHIVWHNTSKLNDEGQLIDGILHSDNIEKRGTYQTIDMTNKYAVQLVFKTYVRPLYDYLEFHTLGEFNYYFKKQYGQSDTVFDNSQVTSDSLKLTRVYFDSFEFITGEEIKNNLSLFFVNNNFKKNNSIRSSFSYDSDMFDVVIFENEWDDKDYVTEDGDHITLKPPSNINPDGSEENNNLLDDISIENILKHSYDMLSSIFDVFSLLGNFVNALLISLPPIFQTVLLWGFTVGIIVIVLKILL